MDELGLSRNKKVKIIALELLICISTMLTIPALFMTTPEPALAFEYNVKLQNNEKYISIAQQGKSLSSGSGSAKVAGSTQHLLIQNRIDNPELGANADYQIGPEDVLEVVVWSHDDLTRQVQVSQSGDISFPMIGKVKANGLSTSELAVSISKLLSNGYIVNPQVTVKVVEYKSKRVYVVGYVNKPGVVPLTGPTLIVEAISLAGGLKEDGGSEVLVIRPAMGSKVENPLKLEDARPGEVIQIDLNQIQAGDVSKNLVLKDGDTILVPKAKYFYVFGEVQRPGQYKYEGKISVLQALTIAGGTTQKASIRSIKITRGNDGTEIEESVKLNQNVTPGDIITVPESFF